MQSLTRTLSRRTHTSRTLYRTASTSARKSDSQPTSPATAIVADAEPNSPPPKIYAQLPQFPPSLNLSQEKLRNLIALYHSSSNFITPETLSDEIDNTFVPLRLTYAQIRPDSYHDLVIQRKAMMEEPDRVVPTANEMHGQNATYDRLDGWSASQDSRTRMVRAALWGVDPMGKIGLETLLEAKAEMDLFGETEVAQKPKEQPRKPKRS